MLIIYNSGRYRMAGRGSLAGLLAYGDANAIVIGMGVVGVLGVRGCHAPHTFAELHVYTSPRRLPGNSR